MSGLRLGHRCERERLAAEEYRRWTPVLQGFIAREFPTLSCAERDELRDGAWEDLCKHRARRGRGGFNTPIGYLRRAALSRGISLRRSQGTRRTDPTDPADEAFEEIAGGDTAEEAIGSFDDERLLSALSTLSREERAVLFCRVHLGLGAAATRSALRMTLKRYELVHARALDRICALYATRLGGPAFERCRLALLRRLENGSANRMQLERAERLATNRDPVLARAVAVFAAKAQRGAGPGRIGSRVGSASARYAAARRARRSAVGH